MSGMGHHQRSLGAQPSEATGQVGTSFYISPGVRPLLVLLLPAETMGPGYAHLPCEVFAEHSGLDSLATAYSALGWGCRDPGRLGAL